MEELDHDIPINVVLLPTFTNETESLIDVYTDMIFDDCKAKSEVRAAIKMIVDEVEELNTKKLFVTLIQSLADLMDNK